MDTGLMNGIGAIRRVVLAAAVALLLATPASAQWGFDQARAAFSPRDLRPMSEILGLDETRQAIIEQFLLDYHEDYLAAREDLEGQIQELRDGFQRGGGERSREDWMTRIEPLRKKYEEFATRSKQMETEIVSNIKAVLSDEQRARWPEYERVLRRQRSLPGGVLSGESVDIIRLVEELQLSEAEQAGVDPLLEQYAVELDTALQRRDQDMERFQNEVRDAMQSRDFDNAMKAMDRQRKLRVTIRDINSRYAQMVKAELADPAAFDRAYREAAYPNVYRETYADQAFAAALQLENVEETTLTNIERLYSTYEGRLAEINQKLERVLTEHEPKQVERQAAIIRSRLSGEDVNRDEDPIRQAWSERSEFEQAMIQQLHALLTPEQIAELPREPRRGGRGDRQNRWRDAGGDDFGGEGRDRGPRRGGGGGDGAPIDDRGFPRGLGGGGGR